MQGGRVAALLPMHLHSALRPGPAARPAEAQAHRPAHAGPHGSQHSAVGCQHSIVDQGLVRAEAPADWKGGGDVCGVPAAGGRRGGVGRHGGAGGRSCGPWARAARCRWRRAGTRAGAGRRGAPKNKAPHVGCHWQAKHRLPVVVGAGVHQQQLPLAQLAVVGGAGVPIVQDGCRGQVQGVVLRTKASLRLTAAAIRPCCCCRPQAPAVRPPRRPTRVGPGRKDGRVVGAAAAALGVDVLQVEGLRLELKHARLDGLAGRGGREW